MKDGEHPVRSTANREDGFWVCESESGPAATNKTIKCCTNKQKADKDEWLENEKLRA